MAVVNCNRKTRLVYGVGINDADYSTQPRVGGKQVQCRVYSCWRGMLGRCYSEKVQSKCPTYAGCKVCYEWHYFMAFRAGMQSQDWEGKELDKDFIGDGKLYSPENCVFLSSELNCVFNENRASKGEYPLGVYWNKEIRKFHAAIQINGKKKYLGLFTSPDDAHSAWRKAKLEIAQSYLESETNPRVRYAIECRIIKLRTGDTN